jgi:hypothetical protein
MNHQKDTTVSVRLIKRRAKDLYILQKDSLIKKAIECAKEKLETSTQCYINEIESFNEEYFINQACRDYATRYNLDYVKVLSVVKDWNK